MARRISIINFKGGVGKTTLAFEFATGLVRYHKPARVLLVDMDHQSSLSIVCLTGARWEEAVAEGKTTTEIFRLFIGQINQMPGREIITEHPLRDRDYTGRYGNLDLVSASLQLDDTEIELTGSIRGNPVQSEWDKRTLVCRWIEETGVDDEYDYIIFDCPPATKIVSQNAIAASHGYVIPVIPEAVMERGAPHLSAMVKEGIDERLKELATLGKRRSIHVPDTALVGVVITRITTHAGWSGYTDDHTQHLASLQRTWEDYLLKPYVKQGTGVSQTLAEGVPVYDRPNAQNVGGQEFPETYRELTAELKKRIDAL